MILEYTPKRLDPKDVMAKLRDVVGIPSKSLAALICMWQSKHPAKFAALEGHNFHAEILADGTPVAVDHTPQPQDDFTSLFLAVHGKNGEPEFIYQIPTWVFRESRKKHHCYSVQFFFFGDDLELRADDTMRAFIMGYTGVTQRCPLTRFKEHWRDAKTGGGYDLHKAWAALDKTGLNYLPRFRIWTGFDTLDEVYAEEERLVDLFTLAPRGLNVIPGGYAGIRKLNQLRLLNGTKGVQPEHRDAAMLKLERQSSSPITHYRRGHIRKLPSGKMTWVSATWVNLEKDVA